MDLKGLYASKHYNTEAFIHDFKERPLFNCHSVRMEMPPEANGTGTALAQYFYETTFCIFSGSSPPPPFSFWFQVCLPKSFPGAVYLTYRAIMS